MSKSDIFKQLGEGAFGKAELAKDKKDGTIVIIKTVKLEFWKRMRIQGKNLLVKEIPNLKFIRIINLRI